MLDYKELMSKVNAELKRPALAGLSVDNAERIVSGLSSGSMTLNNALSGNPLVGYAWGKLIEIYGPESSGKTTLALHAIAEAMRLEESSGQPIPCMFVDAEHALDIYYAEALGVDLNRLAISQPGCAEDALAIVESGVRNGYKLVVIDSVAALTPRAEIEGEFGESHMGLQARLMSQACRKLVALIATKGAIVIFLNQIRMKIGIMFGNPETTSGGNALKFYTTYRIEIRSPRSGKKEGKSLMGYGTEDDKVEVSTIANVKVVKNKMFPPHRKASFTMEYGKGIHKIKDVVTFMETAGMFKSPGKDKAGRVKTPVVKMPAVNKQYTAVGLAKALEDLTVQTEVLKLIKKLGD